MEDDAGVRSTTLELQDRTASQGHVKGRGESGEREGNRFGVAQSSSLNAVKGRRD